MFVVRALDTSLTEDKENTLVVKPVEDKFHNTKTNSDTADFPTLTEDIILENNSKSLVSSLSESTPAEDAVYENSESSNLDTVLKDFLNQASSEINDVNNNNLPITNCACDVEDTDNNSSVLNINLPSNESNCKKPDNSNYKKPDNSEALLVQNYTDSENVEVKKWSFHNFLDRNVRYLNYVPYALGTAGLFIICKKLRITEKFTSNNQIPRDFLAKRIKLRGRVTEVGADGTLHIDHTPIISHKWLKNTSKQAGQLKVRLLGVHCPSNKVEPQASSILNNLKDQEVWFKLWHKDADMKTKEDVLYCIVTKNKWPFNTNLNTECLRTGLARCPPDLKYVGEDVLANRMRSKFSKAENYAIKKRVGIWHDPNYTRVDYAKYAHGLKNVFTFIITCIYNVLKGFIMFISKLFKK